MRISNLRLSKFRRFENLSIENIPATARLIILAGPNGTGKSSLFDALLLRYSYDAYQRWHDDVRYYNRSDVFDRGYPQRIQVITHENEPFKRGSLYVRSAHRHDTDFVMSNLSRQGDVLEGLALQRLIDQDATVSTNYARLASRAMEDMFVNEAEETTFKDYREKLIGEVRNPLLRLFPDLIFTGIGNPLSEGTFRFNKGSEKNFDYKNLSGGEKAAFDLILDFVIKRKSFSKSIYCIDEPEIHLNSRIQGALLGELMELLPEHSQLWIASHSIGMMRKARELYDANPNAVAFLDFSSRDFDQPVVISPTTPTRTFWQGVMNVALDDLATLVAPREVIICEGNPSGDVAGKNAEHDARIYSVIFSDEFPDTTFISAGGSNQVSQDFFGIAAALPKIIAGVKIKRLIDRDDHTTADIADYEKQGITVLTRRHIEAYLFDDEILTLFCGSISKDADVMSVLDAKRRAIAESTARGNPPDDIKSAAGKIFAEMKRILAFSQFGNDNIAFARNALAPLVRPGTNVYRDLKADIFRL